jgi:HD-like signal output (HDOD) protein
MILNPDDFKRAILAIDTLGATPAVLVKVAELTKDPASDIEPICALLRVDGPLAAEIIRLSNSPYYAAATLHSNLNAAVNYVGLREVTRMVNLALARQLFARDLPGYGVSAFAYWSDSVAAALLAEALAKPAGLNPDDAFTLGMLHAIGRVLINRVIDDKGITIFWDGRQPIEAWERGAVGFDHAEAGALLLKHWRFPPAACDVIRWQLKPGKVVQPVSLLGVLQFTLRLLALTGSDFENQDWQLPGLDPYLQAAGLTAGYVAQLVSACRIDFQKILQSVELN